MTTGLWNRVGAGVFWLVSGTCEENGPIIIDYDQEGKIVAFEILDTSLISLMRIMVLYDLSKSIYIAGSVLS